jgi:hypothetical protein
VLTLKSFGPVPALLKEKNPWVGFKDDAAVLTALRAQKAPLKSASACEAWIDALVADRALGRAVGPKPQSEWAKAIQVWAPWSADDVKDIESCDKAPCGVKLSPAEGAQMGAVEPAARRSKFPALVYGRAENYLKSEARKEYEFEGDPVDPWKRFEEMGLKSPLSKPAAPSLLLRRIDFFPGRLKTIHQVIDARVAVSPDRRHATLWRRDVYTDHYFDSWGEWTDVSCFDGEVTVVQALLLELDLMKKTDLLSRMMRSKMRGAIEDNGEVYLKQAFARLSLRASKGGSPAAAATGSSR